MPSVCVIALTSGTRVWGIATSRSPAVIEAMLRSNRPKGTVTERTVRAVRPSAIANAMSPPIIESRTASSAWRVEASRRANAPLLDLLNDLVEAVVDRGNVALGLRQ